MMTSVDDDGGVSQTGPQWRVFFVQNDDGDFIETLTNPGDFHVDDFVLAQEGFGANTLVDEFDDTRANADYQRGYEFPEFLDCNSENESYENLLTCNIATGGDRPAEWNITLDDISISLPTIWTVHHAQVQTPFVGQVWYDNQDQIRVEFGNLQQISADGPTERAGISVRVCGDSDCGMVEDSDTRLAQGFLEGPKQFLEIVFRWKHMIFKCWEWFRIYTRDRSYMRDSRPPPK